MTAFTVRLPYEMTDKLDALASKLDRSRSYLATQATSDFIARESWRLAEIEAGLEEAQRGDSPATQRWQPCSPNIRPSPALYDSEGSLDPSRLATA